MNIKQLHLERNYVSRNNEKIKFIVIHDTANTNKGANAYNHYLYFNRGTTRASVHYMVDSKEIIQIVDDKYSAWHCGDGRGRFGVLNSNSIGIELCINADGDWEKTKENALELIRYLLKKHELSIFNVIRHFDASGKLCPRRMSGIGWKEWIDFLLSV